MSNRLKRLLALAMAVCTLFTCTALGEEASGDTAVEEEIMLDDDSDSGLYIDEGAQDTIDTLDEEVDTSVDPDSLELNTNLPDNVVNILLIGVDTRDKEVTEGMQHADVQIILSINKDDGSIKLSSIMRDLYVTIPTRKSKARINTSYSGKTGGGELAMRTVNHNFEMNIEYYVTINFYGLASIIDAIGGVDVELTKTEAGAINTYLRKHPPAYDNKASGERVALEKKAGVQHLDGVQAVMYARLREIDNDFNRTARQRNLLDLLLKTIMQDMTVDKLISLMETSLPYVKTNVNASTMLELGTSVLGSGIIARAQAGESLIDQMRIPLDETWKYGDANGSSVIMFRTSKRLQENIEALHTFVYGQYYAAPEE